MLSEMGAKDPHREQPGPGLPNDADDFVTPIPFLQEMIDDEIRAQFEILTPTTVNSSQQSPSVSAQDESYSRAPAVLALGVPVVGVFPSGATVICLAGRKTAEIATGNGHEHSGIELIGDQGFFVAEKVLKYQ